MTITEPGNPPPATLRLRIDRQAIAANWRALATLSGTAEAGAAVKANAYGLGVAAAMPALVEAGARTFFVAHWSEVPDVLALAGGGEVAVLHGITGEADAAFARQTGAIPVINSPRQAQLWQDAGGGPCHLMVDTGINRLGIAMEELGHEVIAALDVDMLMSHLASADEDTGQNARQLELFGEAIAQRPARRLSLSNSAGIALGADYGFDLTRPGLALYGGVPRGELEGVIRQAAFPEAAVLQLRQLQPGDMVGYNATFTAPAAMRAATVSIGYADGFLRARGPVTALQYQGHELPVIGRVSMDMVVVDCSQCSALREGDFVQVPFNLASASNACGISQYELLTTLGSRFERA